MSEQTKTLLGPRGIQIDLDRGEVFPDDPGNGTPALVKYRGYTATYWCAWETGEVDGVNLPPTALEWLSKQDKKINAFLYGI